MSNSSVELRAGDSRSSQIIEIQILRGIAVLAVIINHFSDVLPGGFLGVDMFFVISGYVITRSFVELARRGSGIPATLKEFWYRRFWRLFPALSVVATTTILAAFLILPPSDYVEQVEMSIWAAFFAGNIGVEVVTQASYFEPGARENWFLHTWSLGVEEQFYLLFPLLLIFFLSSGDSLASRQKTVVAVTSVTVVSFLAAFADDIESWVWGSEVISTATGLSALLGYYSPLTRAWQFSMGVLIFLISMNRLWRPGKGLALFALFALGGSLALGNESELLPGPLTVVPTVATGVLLLYRFVSQQNQKCRQSFAWIGDLSYSLYLWHWPVWSVTSRFINNGFVTFLVSLFTTFVLAYFTHRLVEKRFTVRRPRQELVSGKEGVLRRAAGINKALALASLLAIGPVTWLVYSSLEQSGDVRPRQSILRVDDSISCSSVSCLDGPIDVLLLGDSHAGALANRLRDRLQEDGLSMVAAISPGCPYLLGDTIKPTESGCGIEPSEFENFLVQSQAQIVVIYGYTAGRFTSTNSGGNQEIELVNAVTGERVSDESGQDAYRTALDETLSLLKKHIKNVVIVSEVPDFEFRPEEVNARGEEASVLELLLAGGIHGQGQTVSRSAFDERHNGFAQINLELAQKHPGTTVVSAWDILCEPEQCSQLTEDGEFIFSDQDHLGTWGVNLLAEGIVRAKVFETVQTSR